MTVSAKLDALRAAVPGCALAAFGDVDAQLVLRSSAQSPWSQDKLDELCKSGARQIRLRAALNPDAVTPREAVIATPQDVRVYVAAPAPAGDVLCCVCRSGVETGQVLRHAKAALSELTGRDQ